MKKRGQAATEYAMTYGWAILAATVAVGVLAYFGVFSPARIAGSRGIMNLPFSLYAFTIVSNSQSANCGTNDCIQLEVIQNGEESIDSVTANLIPKQGISGSPTWTCTVTPNPSPADPWVSGEKISIACHTGSQSSWNPEGSVSADISITYQTIGNDINQVVSGNIRGTSQ